MISSKYKTLSLSLVFILLQGCAAAYGGWNCWNDIDEITQKTKETCELKSSETVNLAFPFNGGTRGKIFIVEDANKNVDAVLGVTNGMLDCPNELCSIRLRADNTVMNIDIQRTYPVNSNISIAIIENTDNFIRLLKSTNTLIIEMPLYQAGGRSFTFSPKGLTWSSK